MKSFKFGETANGLPIIADKFGSQGPQVLILGGVHGDEWEGVVAAKSLQSHFLDSFTFKLQLTLVPIFNFDGVLQKN
ncbi:MAG: succinylglutamate desuccinylase/aspartoacylase family protein, partial [Bdellovibrionales bacterium]|nr:succinylglutamate desuccinylase/aspartoacylase family protein [Bdellovibrionales bacterium]